MFDYRHYVPILKWRQGEYQALLKLDDDVKARLTPLIEIPPIEWDFEKGCLAKTLDDHLHPVADRILKKWGDNLVFVDAVLLDAPRLLGDGSHAIERVFSELRARGVRAVPVTTLHQDNGYQSAVNEVVQKDGRGICLRMSLEDLASVDQTVLTSFLSGPNAELQELDIVIDLECPAFDPMEDFADLLWSLIGPGSLVAGARTLTVAATAFPESMGDLKKFVQLVSRDEWVFYKKLVARAPQGARLPTFGDYAIAHPVVSREDMRLLKPSATLRYTVGDAWRITKGTNVRDNGYGQYQAICKDLSDKDVFAGVGFSPGDKYIEECARGVAKTGNLTTWRWVGTNHHLTTVVADLSSLYAA
jgi:hypothetical protein